MYRVLKSDLAVFSYFLEKYFGITSIIWSIIFIAIGCALIFSVAAKLLEIKVKKQLFMAYIGFSMICSVIVNHLVTMVYTWDSKLQRVMSNFCYVLSFASNRKGFFNALNLADNESNQNHLFQIAMYLNDTQWNTITQSVGESSWYFKKVERAITEILRLGNCHLSLGIIYQNIFAYIPMLLIFCLAIYYFRKRKKTWIIIAASGCLCLIENLGATIFLCIMIYAGNIFFLWTKKTLQNIIQKTGTG